MFLPFLLSLHFLFVAKEIHLKSLFKLCNTIYMLCCHYFKLSNILNIHCKSMFLHCKIPKIHSKFTFCTKIEFSNFQAFDPFPLTSKGCFPSPISNFEPPLSIIHVKLLAAIFYQIFIFSQTDSPLKTKKMVFISSKNLFLFSRYSSFCRFFPYFPYFRDWKKQM